MKRIILAITSLFYLSTAIGANLHFHYCMGELVNWGLAYDNNKECGKCGMQKKAAQDSGCCKDEFKHVKLKIDQKPFTAVIYQFLIAENEPLQPFTASITGLENRETYPSLLMHDPPRSSCTATYIRNCNFRI